MPALANNVELQLADSFKNEIEEYICRGELGEALKVLQDFVSNMCPSLRQETLLLCARNAGFNVDLRKGLVKREESTPIVAALLDLTCEAHRSAIVRPEYQLHKKQHGQIHSLIGGTEFAQEDGEEQSLQADEPQSPKVVHILPKATFEGTVDANADTENSEALSQLRKMYWENFLTRRPPEDTTACICDNVSKTYNKGGFTLHPLTFRLRAGEITAVVGRNASGKTTLLRVVLGDLSPQTGTVSYPMLTRDGSGWAHIKRQIAYISQLQTKWNGRLRTNLNFVAAATGVTGRANRELVDWHIHRYDLSEYEDFPWDELTGGYKTRFELARALLSQPKLLVLDEPLAQLDVIARQQFLSDLVTIAGSFERPIPVIVTSQHLYEIEAVAQQVIVLDEGKCLYCGPLSQIGDGIPEIILEVVLKSGLQSLKSALRGLSILRIEKSFEGFVISFPAGVPIDAVFSKLHMKFGPDLIALRNITKSTRRLFRSSNAA